MDFLHQILGNDLQKAFFVILNLIWIESILSIDNAAVLATMVNDLPEKQRNRALKYGIFGAYFFRGLALIFASYLINIWQLKPLGGLYLVYLAIDYFWSKYKASIETEEEAAVSREKSKIYNATQGIFGAFWSTVIMVEVMDMAFSIDNVFAAVAFTDNIYLICAGVFIGILAMRFVAQAFVWLLAKFPFLENFAFILIAVLGLKLMLSVLTHFHVGDTAAIQWLDSEHGDMALSVFSFLLFAIPIATSFLFNFPKRGVAAIADEITTENE